MPQEIGESREKWGQDIMQMAEDFANNMSSRKAPFWIVYACKPDNNKPGVFRQTMKAYANEPPAILGILVWYVNHTTAEFRFCPSLSAPPDIPLDEALLSDKASDASERVSSQGQKLHALIS